MSINPNLILQSWGYLYTHKVTRLGFGLWHTPKLTHPQLPTVLHTGYRLLTYTTSFGIQLEFVEYHFCVVHFSQSHATDRLTSPSHTSLLLEGLLDLSNAPHTFSRFSLQRGSTNLYRMSGYVTPSVNVTPFCFSL